MLRQLLPAGSLFSHGSLEQQAIVAYVVAMLTWVVRWVTSAVPYRWVKLLVWVFDVHQHVWGFSLAFQSLS